MIRAAFAACAVLDSMAVAILLLDAPLPRPFAGITATVLHGLAVLVLSTLPRALGRRWLCAAAVLTVPCVGLGIAAAVLATPGRGTAVTRRRARTRRTSGFTVAAAHRLAQAPSPCDALDGGDEEQRRVVLAALARRADPEAIVLLRRAAASRDAELALSAALALDRIRERAERRVAGTLPAPEVRRATG